MSTPTPAPRRARGAVYIAALTLLAVFAALGVALATFCGLGLRQSDNHRLIADSRLTAESGLAFMLVQLRQIRLPGTTTEANFADNLFQALGERLNETPNLAGQAVSTAGGTVSVPAVQLDSRTFSCQFVSAGENRCRMVVAGASHGVTRRVAMDLVLVPKLPVVFDYGLASAGKITISGNSRILGVNDPSEASVLSATKDNREAIHIDGSVEIDGDLAVSDDNHNIVITGNPSIAGSTDPNVYCEHLHFGVGRPDFPELDIDPLAALATNVIDSTTDIGNKDTFNNVRIAAGTNPTFANQVTLNGVVYIEAPNVVRFEGGATLNGFVVTQESDQPLEACQLHFAGHVEARGVEALPDTPEFAAVKEQTGTFVLAPGFGVTFAGSFSAINGTIAAEQLTFTGTAEGVVCGSVIGLADRMTTVGGNVEIRVDRKNMPANPAGIVQSFAFQPDPGTYSEL